MMFGFGSTNSWGTVVKTFTLALGLIGCLAPVSSFAATIEVTSLRVENKVNPIGIDVVPRFSWIVTSDLRGTVQQSYHLQLSTSEAGQADTWDSGIVISSQPYGALYGGPALNADTTYFWSVTVATNAGGASASSNFTTGFFSPADWGSSLWIGKGNNTAAEGLSLSNSSWIWTSEASPPNAPPGSRAFRKTFTTPSGKVAKSADIIMTADDQFSLWVNGVSIGSSPNIANIWMTAQTFSVALNDSSILFAVNATNLLDVSTGGSGPAGLIAVINITYVDGSSDIIVTDSTWRASSTVPSGFQATTFSDASWSDAAVLGTYGVSPWGTSVAVTQPGAPLLSLTGSNWIWTSETSPPNAPAASRGFRKTFVVPDGKTAKSVDMVVTCDDLFTLWVNGASVGSSPNEANIWQVAQSFSVGINSSPSVVFAINGTNLADVNTGGDSPAGLLGIFRIDYTDNTSDTFVTDASWRASETVPSGFQVASFDDSAWNNSAVFAAYGDGPWGTQVSIPQPLAEHPAPLLRKTFSVDKPLSYARLYWAAGGYASISLNGSPATDHVLTPGFTNWDVQTQYVGADIMPKLNVGTMNAIGIELGRSHYSVTQGSVWNWDQAPWRAEPSVRAIISLGYTDGTKATVVTDGSWLMMDGPTRLDDVFGGENYDASLEVPDWNTVSLNTSATWTNVQIVAGPNGVLLNQRQDPIRIVESMSPSSVTQIATGTFVFAFPQVVAGWVQLRASGPPNNLITIHFGERLNTDGSVIYQDLQHYYANNFQTDRFWLAGTGGIETFEPKFSYKGFGYVQIEGWPSPTPPTTADVTARVVHTDLQPQGGFTSSSDLLNELQAASVKTMLNNVHSIITDCPQFEKNGWSGDAMLSAEMFLTMLDSQELYAKYTRDLDESRIDNQGPPGEIAPSGGWGEGALAPPWHSAFIFIPYWLYQYRGDMRVMQEQYDAMKSYVEFELARSANGIASTDLGDWNTPETSPLGGNPPEDSRVPATAYLYQMLVVMGEVATVLSQTADISTFQSQAASVKNAFNNAFLSNSTGYYVGVGDSGFRQTHNLLAISFGLTPNNSTTQVAVDAIANDIQNRSIHLNTGALGTKYILPVLSEHGHTDVAFQVAQQTTFPSWGFWLANGATTTWEHWSLEARSLDHHFLGTFQDWMFKDLAGIRVTAPAFQQVSVAPLHTSQLASASAWTLTPYGNFSVTWSNSSGIFTLSLGVPVGVEATVSIPASSAAAVFEGGMSMSSAGLEVQSATGGTVKVAVGSGQYLFSSKA